MLFLAYAHAFLCNIDERASIFGKHYKFFFVFFLMPLLLEIKIQLFFDLFPSEIKLLPPLCILGYA